jgi:molybdopterin molybdotransferase
MIPSRVIILDWSAAGSPKTGRDSIWIGSAERGRGSGVITQTSQNPATRKAAEAALGQMIAQSLDAGQRLLVGVDFALSYPAGFLRQIMGREDALGFWDHLAAQITDDTRNQTNYRSIAGQMNLAISGAVPMPGPFWGNGQKSETPGLPRRKPPLPRGLAEFRGCEAAVSGPNRPKSVWQLAGAGAVGAQSLTGLPMLSRLRRRFAGQIAVWPFEPVGDSAVVLAEVYPSILSAKVRAALAADPALVPDQAQVLLLARALLVLGDLAPLLPLGVQAEGAILGAGTEEMLRTALG